MAEQPSSRPPRSPSCSGKSSSRSTSQDSGGKKPKKSNSDSPSNSSNNERGKSQVDERLRSVLSHPLALPLLHTLHGKNPGSMNYLKKTSNFFNNELESTAFDKVFEKVVDTWRKKDTNTEPHLTKELAKAIDIRNDDTGFHAKSEVRIKRGSNKYGAIDILLTPDETTAPTPLAAIEVGREGKDWWRKLDQNLKYLANMGSHHDDNCLEFTDPLLMVVLTIEGEDEDEGAVVKFEMRLGVFLCAPKSSTSIDDYRMSLLWHSRTNTLEEASKDFGRLLRATSDFGRWREEKESSDTWTYLGPNCCKVKVDTDQDGKTVSNVYKVLRSYDTRFRATQRRWEIYEHYCLESEKLVIVPIPAAPDNEAADDSSSKEHRLWRSRSPGELVVFETPFREGRHFAKKPGEFVPIIKALEKLHKDGFVHGDIRGFNTVFSENEGEGWLIDFDFGGREGKTTTVIPSGYKFLLADGMRRGKGEERVKKWHDWYALGQLIFYCHSFDPPPTGAYETSVGSMTLKWKKITEKNPATPEMIKELKSFCNELGTKNWSISASDDFEEVLLENGTDPVATHPAATGSPPEKKKRG